MLFNIILNPFLLIMQDLGTDIVMSINYNLMHIYCILFVFQFVCPVIAIRERFNLIYKRRFYSKFEVNLILDVYEKLFQLIELINNNLTMPIIYMFGLFLGLMIFDFHDIVVVLHHEDRGFFMVMAFDGPWMFLYLLLWIFTIHSSVSVSSSFVNFNSIEYQILSDLKSLDNESFDLIKAYLKHIRGYKSTFETIFFDIDWRLLFGCISATISFIIIVVQFDKSMEEPSKNVTAAS
ncbi:unnamed protein product [Chironomus riparius]|uniref:Gustatory receptor n=1 Tax=Chironomus riparius TaxID=315576 RepID=A0A9P0J669_9DIPT|nr:unnamed protein product [Chironomus riparius]